MDTYKPLELHRTDVSARHLLVTNDFPPRIGGIQSYLWELWRRLPPGQATVFTRSYPGHRQFDQSQSFPIHRYKTQVLNPSSTLRKRLLQLISEQEIPQVIYDPVLPTGRLGSQLGITHGLILHGAEVSVPANIPFSRRLMGKTLETADFIITASRWAESEAHQIASLSHKPIHYIPPGVDINRFRPLSPGQKLAARQQLGISPESQLVLSVSRLVPRKGMDTLIKAAANLSKSFPKLSVVIVGSGRDRARLQRLISTTQAPVRLWGRVANEQLPLLYGSADVFAMLCRNRWAGLEQEGFGIVFLEAAAAGIPQLAGQSGGAAEAVVAGQTGLVVSSQNRVAQATEALEALLLDPDWAQQMGQAARQRVENSFSYDLLAQQLLHTLQSPYQQAAA